MATMHAASRLSAAGPSPRCPAPVRLSHQRRVAAPVRATPELVDAVSQMVDHLTLALSPVGTPCVIQKCGDQIYRSTLDPAMYKQGGFDWRGALLLATVGGYLFLPPGVLPGFIDYYVLARLKAQARQPVSKADITLGKKLGSGAFGSVYKADLVENGVKVPIIVKKAVEFGEAEVWMNERLSRMSGHHAAEFITAFADDKKPTSYSMPLDNAIWLLWYYEGDNTLSTLMEKKDFPFNMEPVLFGRELRLERDALRQHAVLKVVMKQLLEAVKACHSTGIVHRDIKPQNCILSMRDNKLKLIDMGAAADLRVGINYVPNEYLMDPRFAPPQQYIMSTQTPKPPPAPVAAFLSPVLWAMERPDRFDMFSVGVTMAQLAFAPLRTDNAILAFRSRLQELNWDMDAWRREQEAKAPSLKPAVAAEWSVGFEVLDIDGGWDLLKHLLAYKPSDRWTASRALTHPWVSGASIASGAASVAAAGTAVVAAAGRTISDLVTNEVMEEAVFKSKAGSLTESQLMQELGWEEKAPVAREARQTISWWQDRQQEIKRKLEKRDGTGGNEAARAAAAAAAAAKEEASSNRLRIPIMLNMNRKAAAANGNAANGNAAAANGNGKPQPEAGKFAFRGLFNGSNVSNIAAAAANGKPQPDVSKFAFRGLFNGSNVSNIAAANGNGNGANGNGKAAAANGNGKAAAANGNGKGAAANGNGKAAAAANSNGKAAAAANGNGKGANAAANGKRTPVAAQVGSDKKFDLKGLFSKRD